MKTFFDSETDLFIAVKFFDVNNETPITLSPYILMNRAIGSKCLKGNIVNYNHNDKTYLVERKAYKVIDGEAQYHVWVKDISDQTNTSPSKKTIPTDNSIATSTSAIPTPSYLKLSEASGTQTGYYVILIFPSDAPDCPHSLNIGDTGKFTSYNYFLYGTIKIETTAYVITGALAHQMILSGFTGASPTS